MAELINLRTARKRLRRQQDEQQANANRLAHCLPKHVRELEGKQQAKARRDLERHRMDKRGDDR